MTAIGWGVTSQKGGQATVLQEVDLHIISRDDCNLRYRNAITKNMICAGHQEGGKDTCQVMLQRKYVGQDVHPVSHSLG